MSPSADNVKAHGLSFGNNDTADSPIGAFVPTASQQNDNGQDKAERKLISNGYDGDDTNLADFQSKLDEFMICYQTVKRRNKKGGPTIFR